MSPLRSRRPPAWLFQLSTHMSNIVVAISAVGAIAVLVLHMLGKLNDLVIETNEIVLLFLAELLLLVAVEVRLHLYKIETGLADEISQLHLTGTAGISGIFTSRNDLPEFHKIIEPAKHDIWIFGVELAYVVLQQLTTLENKLRGGCELKILFFDLAHDHPSRVVVERVGETLGLPALSRQIELNLHTTLRWRDGLDDSLRPRVEIRMTKNIPSHNAVFCDKDHPDGSLMLEMFPPNTNRQLRWSVWMTAQKAGKLYERYAHGYQRIWDAARAAKPAPDAHDAG